MRVRSTQSSVVARLITGASHSPASVCARTTLARRGVAQCERDAWAHTAGQRWPPAAADRGAVPRCGCVQGGGAGALGCRLVDCDEGRLALKSVGGFILVCRADATVPHGLLKAKAQALADVLSPSLSTLT